MKNQLYLNTILTTTAAGLLLLCGCKQEPAGSESQKGDSAASSATSASSSKTAATSAEPTSFQQVAAHLDTGGSLYVYLSTEQWLEKLSEKVSSLHGLVNAIPDSGDGGREVAGKAFDIINRLIKDSGVEDVSGFGMSSIAREKGFYHTKAMLHHYKGKGSGFLWTLFGQKEHPLTSLDLLPASTALATFHDLDLALLWSVIQKEVAQSGFPEASAFLNQVPQEFEKAAGLKWDQVLASLGGEYGFVLTLDQNKKITVPLPGADSPLEMPEPALMLVIKVKNDTIFTRIDDALKENGMGATSVDKPDLKMRTVSVPVPLPLPLRPTIAASGGYLFIATTDTVIQDALAVKAGQKPGLKSTPEFQRLAAGVPTQGNAFGFVSRRFGETITQIQRMALPMAVKAQPAQAEFLQSFLVSTNAPFGYSVSANTDEGWLNVGNGNQHPAKVLAVGAVVPAAIAAGFALPAVAKARAAAQSRSQ